MRASDNDSLAIHYSHNIAPVTPASPSEEKLTESTADRDLTPAEEEERNNSCFCPCYYEKQNRTDWMPVILIFFFIIGLHINTALQEQCLDFFFLLFIVSSHLAELFCFLLNGQTPFSLSNLKWQLGWMILFRHKWVKNLFCFYSVFYFIIFLSLSLIFQYIMLCYLLYKYNGDFFIVLQDLYLQIFVTDLTLHW